MKCMIKCKELERMGQLHTENMVRQVYKPFTTQEISDKIAQADYSRRISKRPSR